MKNKKAKHSPGPWRWWDEKTRPNPRPKNYDLAKLYAGDGAQIFTKYGGARGAVLGKTPRQKADEKLIEAAPELFETLQELMSPISIFQLDKSLKKARRLLRRLRN